MLKCHGHSGLVKGRREGVGPLDERDGVGGDLEREPKLLVIGAVQPVCVQVRDCDATLIALRDGERRAGDVVGHAKRPSRSPYQRGLAGAELPTQRHDIARAHERRDGGADRLGLTGSGGLERDQNSPSCSGSGTASGDGVTVTRGGASGMDSSGGWSEMTAGGGAEAPTRPGIREKSASSVASIDGM